MKSRGIIRVIHPTSPQGQAKHKGHSSAPLSLLFFSQTSRHLCSPKRGSTGLRTSSIHDAVPSAC